jgi:hypothetical protein
MVVQYFSADDMAEAEAAFPPLAPVVAQRP